MNKPRRQSKVRTSPRWNRLISARALGILLGVTVMMFVIGYFVAVRVLFPPLPEPENGIAVPSVKGQTVEQAQQTLRALGLRLTEVTEIEHESEPIGVITAQSPLPGQQLREMGVVRVAISAGLPAPAPIALPDSAPIPSNDSTSLEPAFAPAPDSVVWSVPAPADSTVVSDSISSFR